MKYDKSKKYTHDDMMQTAIKQATQWYGTELYRTVNLVLNMVFMAAHDVGMTEAQIVEFDQSIQKYIKDYDAGEFDEKDLIDYVEHDVLDKIRKK